MNENALIPQRKHFLTRNNKKKKLVPLAYRTSMTSFARACGHILFYVSITIA